MDLELSKVTATAYDGDGVPEVQIELFGADDPGDEKAGCVPAESYSVYGFRGRARDPDADPDGRTTNGTRVLYFYEGNALHAIPLDDPRDTHVPQLTKGGSAQYCAVPGAHGVFDGESGSYVLNVPAGAKVTVQVGSGAKVEITDAIVKVGDDSARALAHSQEVLAILALLTADMAAEAVLLTTPPTSTSHTDYATARNSTLTALVSAITAFFTTLPTTKALGT